MYSTSLRGGNMEKFTVKEITKSAAMAAIVFILTYTFKIPFADGYTHLGDCAILTGVLVLGRKKGALSGGIGAAMADLIGGYPQWIIPTFIIKFLMAFVMGLIIEKYMPKAKFNYVLGAVSGGILQIIGYTSVKIIYYGFAQAMVMTPTLLIQTGAGIIITFVFVSLLKGSGMIDRVKAM